MRNFSPAVPRSKPDRHQDQGRVPDVLLVVRIDPFQHSLREEKDIDALLFLERPRIVIEIEELPLETSRSHSRLKAGVRMPLGETSLVKLFIARLREHHRGIIVLLVERVGRLLAGFRPVRLSRDEGERLFLIYEQPVDFGGSLVDDIYRLRTPGKARDIQQTVARGQIQQLCSGPLKFLFQRQIALKDGFLRVVHFRPYFCPRD